MDKSHSVYEPWSPGESYLLQTVSGGGAGGGHGDASEHCYGCADQLHSQHTYMRPTGEIYEIYEIYESLEVV